MIDLRSDTVTRPTAAMRDAMARAEVGDDVLGDDPTANALQEEVARITGKQAALFVTSGTMGNQLGIATQTRPGDDVIVGEGAHPVLYEAGAGAALSGVQFSVAGRGGIYSPEEMEAVVHPRLYWTPRTALVAIENSHNRSGGRLWPQAQARAVSERAHALGLSTHLDGARIWNASVASGVEVATLCAPFDTVSVCFSKGLGAPVGSAFCATRALVDEARRLRKRWGGAMRQVGVLAAAALHALAHHRERLAEDHANARALADGMARLGSVRVRVDRTLVETNIVNLDLEVSAEAVARVAGERGVLILAPSPRCLRAVTHLDVSRGDIDTAVGILAAAIAAVEAP
jgi:threonine aldolase